MSFDRDSSSVKWSSIVGQCTNYRKDNINLEKILQTKKLEIEEFKDLFKYIIYVNYEGRISHIEQLLQYAQTHLSSELKIPDFLADPWFEENRGVRHSALEMSACLNNQEELLFLFARYIKEVKTKKSIPSFVSSMIPMFQYSPLESKSFGSLVDCHTPEQLNEQIAIPNGFYSTVLIQAISYGASVDIIEQLLSAGCDPNGVSYMNSSNFIRIPPIYVVLLQNNSLEEKRMLIDALIKAAEVQKKDNPLHVWHEDKTPLLWAAATSNPDAVNCLLSYPELREKINIKSPGTATCALTDALVLNQDAKTELEKNTLDTIQCLLAHGASADSQDKKLITPLMTAALSGPTLSIFEFFLETVRTKHSKVEFIKLINKQDQNGYTLLNYLLSREKTDGLTALIKKILDYMDGDLTLFNTLSTNGRTALDFALEHLDRSSPDYNELIALPY